jgi:hypothetical protein
MAQVEEHLPSKLEAWHLNHQKKKVKIISFILLYKFFLFLVLWLPFLVLRESLLLSTQTYFCTYGQLLIHWCYLYTEEAICKPSCKVSKCGEVNIKYSLSI